MRKLQSNCRQILRIWK